MSVPERAARFNRGLRSSNTDEWATPLDLFRQLDQEFGPFTLDPCATAQNAKCSTYFTKEVNGLTRSWGGHRVFMNPPYGAQIGNWMRKAWQESQRCPIVVCLVPARTDSAWWHDYAMKGACRFIRGRLRFGGHRANAPFPSAIVIYVNKQAE